MRETAARILQKEFQDFGTRYESDTIHALVKNEGSAMTAKEIEEQTGVPVPRVYGIMGEFEKKGFVKLISEEPRSWMIDKNQFFASLEKSNPDVAKKYSDLLPRTKEISIPMFLQRVAVGKDSVSTTSDLYQGAKRQIRIISRIFDYLPDVLSGLNSAVTKPEMRIQVLLTGKREGPEKAKVERAMGILNHLAIESNRIEIRLLSHKDLERDFHIDDFPIHLSIIDPPDKNELYEVYNRNRPYRGAAVFTVDLRAKERDLIDAEVAITRDPRLVKTLDLLFELFWKHPRRPMS